MRRRWLWLTIVMGSAAIALIMTYQTRTFQFELLLRTAFRLFGDWFLHFVRIAVQFCLIAFLYVSLMEWVRGLRCRHCDSRQLQCRHVSPFGYRYYLCGDCGARQKRLPGGSWTDASGPADAGKYLGRHQVNPWDDLAEPGTLNDPEQVQDQEPIGPAKTGIEQALRRRRERQAAPKRSAVADHLAAEQAQMIDIPSPSQDQATDQERSSMPGIRPILLFAFVLSSGLSTASALPLDDVDTPSASASGRRADQEALKNYATLVGDWRGTGQPRRGSARDTWRESAAWSWDLSPKSAALVGQIEGGRYLKAVRLRQVAEEPGLFQLEATLADGSKRTFSGRADDREKLVLEALEAGAEGEGPQRISLTPLHDTRFLMLLEAQDADTGLYNRLGEVGYTRQGVAFAAGDSYPLCIVTGGRGETEVKYKGKTYWVCCSGCKDLFEEDPETILAEAAERDKAK